MQERARNNPKVRWELNAVVDDVLGVEEGKVTAVRIRDVDSGESKDIPADGLFVAVGHDPTTALFEGVLDMDDAGYLLTKDGSTATNVTGVFAAGDVVDHVYRQAITAAGMGCMAALDAERWLAPRARPPPRPPASTRRLALPYFICPNCKDRSFDADGLEGLSHQSVGCRRCGFGFLFELLEDYFPRPGTGMLACDREGRILAAGRGLFELTGYREQDIIGRTPQASLGPGVPRPPTRSPWRSSGACARWRSTARCATRPPTATSRCCIDVFPAYDDDGGVLVALAPKSGPG